MTNPFGWSDAAKRAADNVMIHYHLDRAHVIGKWVAVRLSDGGSDGVLYDERDHAIAHQLHERQCAYIRIPVDGVTPAGMESFLRSMRTIYDAGGSMIDPNIWIHRKAIVRKLS